MRIIVPFLLNYSITMLGVDWAVVSLSGFGIVLVMTQDVFLSSPYLGKSQFVRPDKTSFWTFLRRYKIPFDKADFPFLTTHKIPRVKRQFDFGEYLSLGSRGEALAYLYQGMGKTWNYVGPVLDRELTHGFNDHTDRHTLWVSQTGVELLQRAGLNFDSTNHFDEITEVLMTLVGMTHDLGNFMGRKEHSTYSAWLLCRLFDDYERYPREWRAALYAVLFHEEPVLKDVGMALKEGTPLQWALVAADKMHVGRDRIGGRSIESGLQKRAFEEDVHILIDSLIVRSSWVMKAGTFCWYLDFSIDQLQERFASFSKGNDRLWLPRMFQMSFLKRGVKYRETFVKLFLETYGDRVNMLQESVFLLFPHLNRFEVILADTDTRDKVGSGEMTIVKGKR